MHEQLESNQINRLWDYKQHVDNIFYNRLNFFLVFESVLLATFGLIYSRPISSILILKVISILGLSFTLIWGYAQHRQRYVVEDIRSYLNEVMPEYKTMNERRSIKLRWPHRKSTIWLTSSLWHLTYLVPTLIALVWFTFLLFL